MHIEKFQAIIHFKDGSTVESDWYYTDIHCRQYAEQFLDDENYNGYVIDSRMFYEEIDITDRTPDAHPIHFPKGGQA